MKNMLKAMSKPINYELPTSVI